MDALSDYLDDDLAIDLRVKLEAHLSECTTCQAIYDSTRKTLTIVTDSGSFELPANLSERLQKKIMGEARSERRRQGPQGAKS